MMKRRFSILLILLVNIVILAHAVVPHHHHNKVFEAIVKVLGDDAQSVFNHEHEVWHHHHAAWTIASFSVKNIGKQLSTVAMGSSEPLLIDSDGPETYNLYYHDGQTEFLVRANRLRAPPDCRF